MRAIRLYRSMNADDFVLSAGARLALGAIYTRRYAMSRMYGGGCRISRVASIMRR